MTTTYGHNDKKINNTTILKGFSLDLFYIIIIKTKVIPYWYLSLPLRYFLYNISCD